MRLAVVLILFLAVSESVFGDAIFTIGNSLTWDTKPASLDGDVDYHIYCNRNLKYIHDNPQSHCISSSTPWTTALSTKQYDWISVQPFSGTTLDEDVSIISGWMAMQPEAKLVIHPGWSAFSVFPTAYEAGNPDDMMRPSPEYVSDLIARLNLVEPLREIRSTRTNDLLYSIWQDTEAGIGPFSSMDELARDQIHMGYNTGRYLAHNALRLAIDQPISESSFTIDAKFKSYFDAKLTGVPEPASMCFFASAVLVLAANRRRQR